MWWSLESVTQIVWWVVAITIMCSKCVYSVIQQTILALEIYIEMHPFCVLFSHLVWSPANVFVCILIVSDRLINWSLFSSLWRGHSVFMVSLASGWLLPGRQGRSVMGMLNSNHSLPWQHWCTRRNRCAIMISHCLGYGCDQRGSGLVNSLWIILLHPNPNNKTQCFQRCLATVLLLLLNHCR